MPLGTLDTYDGIYDIESIEMTILQPRCENISTFTISKKDLLSWAENFLKPTAELAYNGEGDFHAGGHCQFCKPAVNGQPTTWNLQHMTLNSPQPWMIRR